MAYINKKKGWGAQRDKYMHKEALFQQLIPPPQQIIYS